MKDLREFCKRLSDLVGEARVSRIHPSQIHDQFERWVIALEDEIEAEEEEEEPS